MGVQLREPVAHVSLWTLAAEKGDLFIGRTLIENRLYHFATLGEVFGNTPIRRSFLFRLGVRITALSRS
jgi:hypothetical protein